MIFNKDTYAKRDGKDKTLEMDLQNIYKIFDPVSKLPEY